jgi:hypothetical protein
VMAGAHERIENGRSDVPGGSGEEDPHGGGAIQ